MEISYFLLAKYAEQTPAQGATIVGGGFDIVFAPDLPHLFPTLFAVGKVIMDRREAQERHTLSVRISDPFAELMAETDIKEIFPHELPEGRNYLNLGFTLGFFGLAFQHEGLYQVELVFDDTSRQSLRFRVDRVHNPPVARPEGFAPPGD